MIGDYLKNARTHSKSDEKGKCLTLESVAQQTGCTRGYISQVENNKEIPSKDLIEKLSDVYGLEPERALAVAGHLPDPMTTKIEKSKLYWDVIQGLSDLSAPDLLAIKQDYGLQDD